MKRLVLIGLCCLLFNSCGDGGDTHHRTYVISKSQLQTEAEAEAADLELDSQFSEE